MMLSTTAIEIKPLYAECRYVECLHSWCRYSECCSTTKVFQSTKWDV